jgi:putative SOS response-associated peptidase YedK
MPVILTTADEVETWMTASLDEAMKLQRPLSDGALKIVARGVKEDSVLRALPLNYLDADDETNR